MMYDTVLVSRVQALCTGADIHRICQHLTSYISAAQLIEACLAGSAEGDIARLREVCDRHERILRSYLVTHDISESTDCVDRYLLNQAAHAETACV
jgi:hypothetical protein